MYYKDGNWQSNSQCDCIKAMLYQFLLYFLLDFLIFIRYNKRKKVCYEEKSFV